MDQVLSHCRPQRTIFLLSEVFRLRLWISPPIGILDDLIFST